MRTISLAVALFALAACGGNPPATTTTPQASAADPGAAPPADPSDPPDPDVAAGEAAAPAGDLKCPGGFGPVELSEAQQRQRYGTNARTFADAPSTKERPIEVCGVRASQQWLRGTACADGSPPKQDGRSGNVGPGGRCNAIIDLYSVTCPEARYDVFIDIYMCGPGESLMGS